MNQQRKSKNNQNPVRSGAGTAHTQHTARPMTYIFSVIILTIVVVTFIALPYYRNVVRSPTMTFGYYNGQPIKYAPGNYFAQQRDLLAQQLQSSGQKLTTQQQAYEIWQGAFERTVIHTAILQAAKRSNLYVTSGKIDQALTHYGPYTVNGQFSTTAYEQTSQQQRNQTRALFQQELIGQQFRTDVLQSVKISKSESQFVEQMASPERKFRFVGYDESSFPKAEVIKYGKANSRQFRTIGLSRITVKSGASTADVLLKRLQNNPNLFEQIAKTQSRDAYSSRGGVMGVRTYTSLTSSFESQGDLNKLFTMKRGQISGVIRAPFGWTIYRIDQAAQPPNFSDPKTIKTVQSYLQEYKTGMIESYFVSLGKKFRAAAEKNGFDAAAAGQKLTVHSSNFFPLNYGNSPLLPSIQNPSKGPSLAPVAYDSKSLQTLFSMKIGSISQPMIVGNYILVVTPTAQEPAPKGYAKRISQILPLLASRFTQQTLYREILSSNALTDNFTQVFQRNFNFSNTQPGA